jgi:hypothetical protein
LSGINIKSMNFAFMCQVDYYIRYHIVSTGKYKQEEIHV